MQIRKLQRIFSAAILLIIILTVSPYLIHIPETVGTDATRLIIVYEKIPVKVNVPKKLIIKAVDDKGKIDTSRDDLIGLNLTSLSYSKTMAKLSQYELKLVNGTTTVTLTGPEKEILQITVNWVDGKASLEHYAVCIQVGGYR